MPKMLKVYPRHDKFFFNYRGDDGDGSTIFLDPPNRDLPSGARHSGDFAAYRFTDGSAVVFPVGMCLTWCGERISVCSVRGVVYATMTEDEYYLLRSNYEGHHLELIDGDWHE